VHIKSNVVWDTIKFTPMLKIC